MAIHNLIVGLAVGAAFVIDLLLGIMAWVVAAAHEIPQELGDFAVLIHGGWSRKTALTFNFVSALTFPAGNFLYIAAVGPITEFKNRCRERADLLHVTAFIMGLAVLLLVRLWLAHPE